MFTAARLRLTAWYLAIIMLVSFMFSFAIYRVLTFEINRFEQLQRERIERRLMEGEVIFPDRPFRLFFSIPDPDLINDIKNRIRLMLLAVNSLIFALAGCLGYLLAGRTLRPIQDMVDGQNRFISDASHELKTPLTSLRTAFEVYLRAKRKQDPEVRELISDSIDEVDRMQNLTESLLTLSQYQDAPPTKNFTKISLKELITEVLKKTKPVAQAKKIDINYDKNDFFVAGDKLSLVQLLLIIIDNALKYSPPNSHVTISTKREKRSVQISVTDEGEGIAPHDIPYIFDRFYRSDLARTNNGENGFGLGLSIAKKIIENHHGSIGVNSKLGKGSVFRIWLPVYV